MDPPFGIQGKEELRELEKEDFHTIVQVVDPSLWPTSGSLHILRHFSIGTPMAETMYHSDHCSPQISHTPAQDGQPDPVRQLG